VLMDIGMPVMDGITSCERMRETEWGADIVIVAISGWGQEQDRKRSAKAGFDQHLVKPVDRQTLDRLLVGIGV
jgi:CheY-like chemotaxis protein